MQTKKPYKLVPSNKYSRRWTAAKKKFKEDTGKKYPATHKEFKAFGLKLFSVREGQGIESALKKAETWLPKAHISTDGLKTFRNVCGEFNVAYPKYIRYLKGLVGHPPPGVRTADFNDGLQHLEDELEAINAALKIEISRARLVMNAVEGAKEEYDRLAEELYQRTRLNVGLALAWIEKRRANPNPADFNKKIGATARNITQDIGNVDKLSKLGYVFDRGEPTELFEALTDWADKDRKLDASAGANTVLEELDRFERAVEAVAMWAR